MAGGGGAAAAPVAEISFFRENIEFTHKFQKFENAKGNSTENDVLFIDSKN